MPRSYKESAFTLVELSVVLVIVALIVGGTLAGQALVRSAELKKITTELGEWQTAVTLFRQKYNALPGDMLDAERFWGTNSFCGSGNTATVSAGVCDGNGDGALPRSNSACAWRNLAETYQFWRHLSEAGLIPGKYTGFFGAPTSDRDVDHTMPVSQSGEELVWAAYSTMECDAYSAYNDPYWGTEEREYGFVLGEFTNYPLSVDPTSRISPEEAWSLDKKLDDGKPGLGNVKVLLENDSNNRPAWCADTDDYADADTAEYNLDPADTVSPTCALFFSNAF